MNFFRSLNTTITIVRNVSKLINLSVWEGEAKKQELVAESVEGGVRPQSLLLTRVLLAFYYNQIPKMVNSDELQLGIT